MKNINQLFDFTNYFNKLANNIYNFTKVSKDDEDSYEQTDAEKYIELINAQLSREDAVKRLAKIESIKKESEQILERAANFIPNDPTLDSQFEKFMIAYEEILDLLNDKKQSDYLHEASATFKSLNRWFESIETSKYVNVQEQSEDDYIIGWDEDFSPSDLIILLQSCVENAESYIEQAAGKDFNINDMALQGLVNDFNDQRIEPGAVGLSYIGAKKSKESWENWYRDFKLARKVGPNAVKKIKDRDGNIVEVPIYYKVIARQEGRKRFEENLKKNPELKKKYSDAGKARSIVFRERSNIKNKIIRKILNPYSGEEAKIRLELIEKLSETIKENFKDKAATEVIIKIINDYPNKDEIKQIIKIESEIVQNAQGANLDDPSINPEIKEDVKPENIIKKYLRRKIQEKVWKAKATKGLQETRANPKLLKKWIQDIDQRTNSKLSEQRKIAHLNDEDVKAVEIVKIAYDEAKAIHEQNPSEETERYLKLSESNVTEIAKNLRNKIIQSNFIQGIISNIPIIKSLSQGLKEFDKSNPKQADDAEALIVNANYVIEILNKTKPKGKDTGSFYENIIESITGAINLLKEMLGQNLESRGYQSYLRKLANEIPIMKKNIRTKILAEIIKSANVESLINKIDSETNDPKDFAEKLLQAIYDDIIKDIQKNFLS